MLIYRNKTNQIQIVSINSRINHFSPGEYVVGETNKTVQGMSNRFEPSITLYEYLQNNPSATVNIKRSFALGDVIMAFALCRWVNFQFPLTRITLYTKTQYAEIFKVACEEIEIASCQNGILPQSDYSISIDGVMEFDHRSGPYEKMHRIHIALHILGFPEDEWPHYKTDFNWSFHVGNAAHVFAHRWYKEFYHEYEANHEYTVAIQARGSQPFKTLPRDVFIDLVKILSQYVNVVIIGNNIQDNIKLPGVRMTNRCTINQTMAIMKRCNAVVCLDSGPLWMAHVMRKPIVLISGPTHPEGRLTITPNPHLSVAIRTEKWIDCSPCGERAEACNQQYTCIRQVNKKVLIQRCMKALDQVISAYIWRIKSNIFPKLSFNQPNRKVKDFILMEGLQKQMDNIIEDQYYLTKDASQLLLDFGWRQEVREGDIVYDKDYKKYKIDVNMYGTWVIGAAENERDANFYMESYRFTPAITLMSAVAFLRKIDYNKVKEIEQEVKKRNIQCQYLNSILEKLKNLNMENVLVRG